MRDFIFVTNTKNTRLGVVGDGPPPPDPGTRTSAGKRTSHMCVCVYAGTCAYVPLQDDPPQVFEIDYLLMFSTGTTVVGAPAVLPVRPPPVRGAAHVRAYICDRILMRAMGGDPEDSSARRPNRTDRAEPRSGPDNTADVNERQQPDTGRGSPGYG